MKLKTKSRYLMHLVQPSTPMAASAAAAPGLRPSWAVAGRERKGRPLPPPPEGRGPSKAKVFLFPFPVLLCPSGSLPTPRTFFPLALPLKLTPIFPKDHPQIAQKHSPCLLCSFPHPSGGISGLTIQEICVTRADIFSIPHVAAWKFNFKRQKAAPQNQEKVSPSSKLTPLWFLCASLLSPRCASSRHGCFF